MQIGLDKTKAGSFIGHWALVALCHAHVCSHESACIAQRKLTCIRKVLLPGSAAERLPLPDLHR